MQPLAAWRPSSRSPFRRMVLGRWYHLMDHLIIGSVQPATTQLVSARIRDAYVYAITQLPSTTHHRLWKEATKVETDDRGRKRPVHHRCITWTALQLSVDHAFTGSYASTAGSVPQIPPTHTLARLCGEILCDPEHILRECRLFYQPRIDTAIDTPHHTLSLRELFNAHPNRLLPIPETIRRRGSTSGLWTAKGQTKGGSGRGDSMTGSGKSHHDQLSPRIHVSIYNDPAPETGTPYLLLFLSLG